VESAPVRVFLAVAAVLLGAVAAPPAARAATPRVLAIHFDEEVNPVTERFVRHQLDRAVDENYDAVVLLLDTPGGLTTSMDAIVRHELASKVPVIAYVAPSGAAAASAGVFLAEAADVLAMAPATNLGSSTPIDLGGGNLGADARRKAVNHYAAKLRALATTHGRNGAWADRAVRSASNLTAGEALRRNAIDIVAPSLPALLERLDGRRTVPKGFTLHTADASVTHAELSFFGRVLNVLIDPNLLFLLFFAGLGGIAFEVFHPGVVLPGALGAVALIVALFGFATLPTSWAGVILILLAGFLFVVDAHVASHGALTLSGMVSLIVGGLLLFQEAPERYQVSTPLVVAVAVILGGFWAFALTKAVQVRRRPATVGTQTMIGAVGEVRPSGLVFVRGELWTARPLDGRPLEPGQHVRVEAVDGLLLTVAPT
jgi:membrane-bound serine protease (ClpP class)